MEEEKKKLKAFSEANKKKKRGDKKLSKEE